MGDIKYKVTIQSCKHEREIKAKLVEKTVAVMSVMHAKDLFSDYISQVTIESNHCNAVNKAKKNVVHRSEKQN